MIFQTDNKMELYIEIKNGQPIELLDLNKSLIALGNQFNKYANEHGYPEANRDTKLYIEKIESGSILLTLFESAKPVLPFISDVNTIVGFAEFVKKVFTYFKTGKGERPVLKESDYKDFNSILSPIAKDDASQFNITAKDNATIYVAINTNSIEANAIQNKLTNEINFLKQLNEGTKKERIIFYWEQAKGDISKDVGNKGVIEELSKSPKKIIFGNDEIKYEMLHSDQNPFLYFYVVDAEVSIIQEKPVAYRITKMHEKFLKDEA